MATPAGDSAANSDHSLALLVDMVKLAQSSVREGRYGTALSDLVLMAELLSAATDTVAVAARLSGHTYQEIGDRLGITRQAAHVRYSPRS